MGVLVDSSVWIEAAKARGKVRKPLSALINSDQIVYYTSPIQAEVCQGTRSQREFEILWDAFKGFKLLPVRDEHWEQAAWNYFRCRKNGVTVTTIDCLLATIARTYRVPLWTLDRLFSKMQPIIGFDLYTSKT